MQIRTKSFQLEAQHDGYKIRLDVDNDLHETVVRVVDPYGVLMVIEPVPFVYAISEGYNFLEGYVGPALHKLKGKGK